MPMMFAQRTPLYPSRIYQERNIINVKTGPERAFDPDNFVGRVFAFVTKFDPFKNLILVE